MLIVWLHVLCMKTLMITLNRVIFDAFQNLFRKFRKFHNLENNFDCRLVQEVKHAVILFVTTIPHVFVHCQEK